MKFNKWVKSVTAAVVLSLALSVTAFGAETDADELTMVTSEQTERGNGWGRSACIDLSGSDDV